ncbi:MAG TPA: CAP domain-containing protein [Kofleriaceae bacterium]
MSRTIFAVMLGIGTLGGCVVGPDDPAAVSQDPGSGDLDNGDEHAPGSTSALALTLNDGLDAEERVFLQKINDYRVSLGVAPLQVSVALTNASDYHAVDMATQNYFAHDSIDGTTWSARIKRYYNYNTYMAENIAAGNAGGDATFTQWKNSAGHDANMKNASYRVIGIARAYNASATYRWYWVTDFGGYVDEVMTTDPTTPPPPPPTATNLLENGGFETTDLGAGVFYTSVTSTGRWFWGSQQGTAAIGSQAAATGAQGLRVTDALVGSISVAQLVAATAGKTYTLAASTRRVSGTTSQVVYLDFLDASRARIGRTTLSGGSNPAFHALTTTRVAPAGTAYVRVAVYGYQANNDYASTYDWDDFTLTAQ